MDALRDSYKIALIVYPKDGGLHMEYQPTFYRPLVSMLGEIIMVIEDKKQNAFRFKQIVSHAELKRWWTDWSKRSESGSLELSIREGIFLMTLLHLNIVIYHTDIALEQYNASPEIKRIQGMTFEKYQAIVLSVMGKFIRIMELSLISNPEWHLRRMNLEKLWPVLVDATRFVDLDKPTA